MHSLRGCIPATSKRFISQTKVQGALTLLKPVLPTSSPQLRSGICLGLRCKTPRNVSCVTATSPVETMAVDRPRPHSFWNGSNYETWDVENATVKQDPYLATLNIPGLTPDNFNIYGKLKVQRILYSIFAAHIYVYHKPYDNDGNVFLDWSTLTLDRFPFVSSLDISFSRASYDRSLDRSRFDIKVHLDYVGNSSLSHLTKLYSKDLLDQPLMTQVTTVVFVDHKARKPVPFPAWFRDKFSDKSLGGQAFVFQPFQRPDTTLAYRFKVRWSDTDVQKHTNYTNYLTFVQDAIHAALRLSKECETPVSVSALGGFSEKMLMSGLKNVQIGYRNESLEGQEIVAHIWQEPQDCPHVLRCSMERDSTVICQLKLQYFD